MINTMTKSVRIWLKFLRCWVVILGGEWCYRINFYTILTLNISPSHWTMTMTIIQCFQSEEHFCCRWHFVLNAEGNKCSSLAGNGKIILTLPTLLTCPHLSSHVLICLHIPSDVLRCHHLSSHVLTWPHVPSHVLTCPHMSSHELKKVPDACWCCQSGIADNSFKDPTLMLMSFPTTSLSLSSTHKRLIEGFSRAQYTNFRCIHRHLQHLPPLYHFLAKVFIFKCPKCSRASLTVRFTARFIFLRYEVEKGLRAVY